jgi:hypothetical protein
LQLGQQNTLAPSRPSPHGKDKREGNEVQFLVAIFPAGGGKAEVFYADWDADAPSDIKQKLNGIMNSIKLHK